MRAVMGGMACLPLVASLMKLTSYKTFLRKTQKAQVLSVFVVCSATRYEEFCMSHVCIVVERKVPVGLCGRSLNFLS